MKKLFWSGWAVFLLLMALALSGCNGNSGNSDNSDTDDSIHPDSDNVLPPGLLGKPPGGQKPENVPQFVSFGFDDDSYGDSVEWMLNFLKPLKNSDGTPVRVSFFLATGYLHKDEISSDYATPNDGEDLVKLRALWKRIHTDGHEIGNHTQHHFHGYDQWDSSFKPEDVFTAEKWKDEMSRANEVLTNKEYGLGLDPSEITGFRTPFLGYTDATFVALEQLGFKFDCSIEDGWQPNQNGTNYNWPYNLANGSEGDKVVVEFGFDGPKRDPVGSHPTLYEMPVSPIIVPPDYRAKE
jgi:hypothetical protein